MPLGAARESDDVPTGAAATHRRARQGATTNACGAACVILLRSHDISRVVSESLVPTTCSNSSSRTPCAP
jgi:hypothetical protein